MQKKTALLLFASVVFALVLKLHAQESPQLVGSDADQAKILEDIQNIIEGKAFSIDANGNKITCPAASENSFSKECRSVRNKYLKMKEHIEKTEYPQQYLENKYKMPFCNKSDLFSVLYFSGLSAGKIEDDCLYISVAGPFKVIQALKDGVLVGVRDPNPHMPNQIFFVKTNKQYVDEDVLNNIIVRSSGVKHYRNVLGADKTVRSFQYLGDINLKVDHFSRTYELLQQD